VVASPLLQKVKKKIVVQKWGAVQCLLEEDQPSWKSTTVPAVSQRKDAMEDDMTGTPARNGSVRLTGFIQFRKAPLGGYRSCPRPDQPNPYRLD